MNEQTKPSELYVSLEAEELYQDCTNILLCWAEEPTNIAEAHDFLLRLQSLALAKLMNSPAKPITPKMLEEKAE